jgi:hypothetical protein
VLLPEAPGRYRLEVSVPARGVTVAAVEVVMQPALDSRSIRMYVGCRTYASTGGSRMIVNGVQARRSDERTGVRRGESGARDPEKRSARAAALAVLVDALRDESILARRHAALLLGRLGPAGRAAVPALRRALRDEDLAVRWAVIEALEAIDPHGW